MWLGTDHGAWIGNGISLIIFAAFGPVPERPGPNGHAVRTGK